MLILMILLMSRWADADAGVPNSNTRTHVGPYICPLDGNFPIPGLMLFSNLNPQPEVKLQIGRETGRLQPAIEFQSSFSTLTINNPSLIITFIAKLVLQSFEHFGCFELNVVKVGPV